MTVTISDERIREVADSARPFSLVILRWTPERRRTRADAIELEHQRRLVALRAEGILVMMAPVLSGDLAGILMMTSSAQDAERIIADDPCVRAGMQTYEIHPSLGIFADPDAT